MKVVLRQGRRAAALLVLLALCVTTLSGCVSTGSKTPEALVKRVIHAAFSMNGEDLMDCILPELSTMYRASLQLSASITGQDPEKALAEEMYRNLAAEYGLEEIDPSELSAQAFIISKEERSATATVQCLLVINIDGQYDCEEGYFVTSKIRGSWYFANLLVDRPEGYSPTEVMITDEQKMKMLADYDTNRIQRTYNSFNQINPEDAVVLPNQVVLDSNDIQATWDVLDAYLNDPNSAERLAMEDYLYNGEYSPFFFELFVKEYQAFNLGSMAVRASVATTEGVNSFKNATSQFFSALMETEEVEHKLSKLFNVKDTKVAQIIIEYLASLDFSQEAQRIEWKETALSIADTETTALKHVVSLSMTDTDMETLLDNVKKLRFVYEVNPRTTRAFALGDVLDLDENNVRKVAEKLVGLTQADNGLIKLAINSDLGANVKLSFLDELAQLEGASPDNLFSVMQKEIEDYEENRAFNNAMKGVKSFLWCASSALKSADAYNQLLVQQAVLNQQKEYLTNILEHADCANAETMAQYIIDILTATVAKGTVATIADAFNANMVGNLSGELTDELAESFVSKVIGQSTISAAGYMFFFDLGTDVAMLLSDAGNTKLQAWGVEDLYDEFQNAKKDVGSAIAKFYVNPTAEQYEALYYTVEYYSLLVRSGSKKVSDILVADSQSAMSKFWALFSEEKEAQRLANIQSAKDIPSQDLAALNRFRRRLFPTMAF